LTSRAILVFVDEYISETAGPTMASLRDQKCSTGKCGTGNRDPKMHERKCGTENAEPGKCPTWHVNNEFHVYTQVTDTSSRPHYM